MPNREIPARRRGPVSGTVRRTVALATLLGAAASWPAHAQNLADVYQKALVQDARMASAHAAYRAGIEKLPQGRSQLLPSLTLNGEKTYADSELTYEPGSPFESGNRSYYDRKYSATLTQPLFRMQNIAAYRQSQAQTASAEAQHTQARQDLMLRVTQAYFDLLTAQQVYAAATAHTAAMRIQDEKGRIQLHLGSGSRLEASEAKAKYEIARAQEVAARHDLDNKRKALERITNEPPGTLAELGPNARYTLPEPASVEAWTKIAEQENLQLIGLRYNMEAAQREVDRERAGHYPTVDIVAQYAYDHATGSVYTSATSDTLVKSAGVRVEMPIYQGGLINSKVREAVGNLEKARADLEDARRDVLAQTTQSYNGATDSLEQVHALEQALDSSREAARAERVGMEVGTRNQVDLLNAEQQVYETTRDLAKARAEFVMNRMRLLAFSGRLAEADMETLNAQLVSRPTVPTSDENVH